MKRLFYTTSHLDEVQLISEEVHDLGVDDDHFYVVSHDQQGLQKYHLHGCDSFDKTRILATHERSRIFGVVAAVLTAIALIVALPLSAQNVLLTALACAVVYGLIRFVSFHVGAHIDNYFRTLFNNHLDNGEAVLVIDVEPGRAQPIIKQMNKHASAHLLLESSNLAAPIPS